MCIFDNAKLRRMPCHRLTQTTALAYIFTANQIDYQCDRYIFRKKGKSYILFYNNIGMSLR